FAEERNSRRPSFSFIFIPFPTITTAAHPHNTAAVPPPFRPDLLRQDVASPSGGAIDFGVATPPRFHPSEVVHAAAAVCFGVLQKCFRGFSAHRYSAIVVATKHAL
ncbi:hypothetical protein A2U01_0030936, partial [Trifolium medium]|nr:hypothetical protein [Trifolium medium]